LHRAAEFVMPLLWIQDKLGSLPMGPASLTVEAFVRFNERDVAGISPLHVRFYQRQE
jgi:hypothetical protein